MKTEGALEDREGDNEDEESNFNYSDSRSQLPGNEDKDEDDTRVLIHNTYCSRPTIFKV